MCSTSKCDLEIISLLQKDNFWFQGRLSDCIWFHFNKDSAVIHSYWGITYPHQQSQCNINKKNHLWFGLWHTFKIYAEEKEISQILSTISKRHSQFDPINSVFLISSPASQCRSFCSISKRYFPDSGAHQSCLCYGQPVSTRDQLLWLCTPEYFGYNFRCRDFQHSLNHSMAFAFI